MGFCIFSGRSSDKLGGFNCSSLPAGPGGNGEFEGLSPFNRVGGIPEEGGGRVVVSGEGVALLAAGSGGGGGRLLPTEEDDRRWWGGGGGDPGRGEAAGRRVGAGGAG